MDESLNLQMQRTLVFMSSTANQALMRSINSHAGYDELPASIQLLHTPNSFKWLTDEGRARLIESETQPDQDVTE